MLLAPPERNRHPPASARAGAYDQSNQSSLLDQYEYAMYGKIYKWKQEKPKEAVCVPRAPGPPPHHPPPPPPPRPPPPPPRRPPPRPPLPHPPAARSHHP
jgi:hypothetical protein